MISRNAMTQLVRFGIVGVASNGVLYLAYLLLSSAGLGAKTAMSLLYVVGVIQTFVFNKRWSFRHDGVHGPAFVRYCIVYVGGYLLNLLALFVLVDMHGYPHQVVQGILILTLAALMFVLQKYWVFAREKDVESSRNTVSLTE